MTSQRGRKASHQPNQGGRSMVEGLVQEEGSSSGLGGRAPVTIDDMIKLQSNMIEKFAAIVAGALRSSSTKQANTVKTTRMPGASDQHDDTRSTGRRSNHKAGSETVRGDKHVRRKRDASEAMGSFDSRRSHSRGEANNDARSRSPFSANILAEEVNPKQKWPAVDKYYGYTGPLEHLRAFDDALDLHSNLSDALQCHLFLYTLKDEARMWFDNLPVGSVTSFAD